ncbi:hypothetical protein LX36DRAFT_592050 [Colletotrichum falcatum]|nr:hypothetical protein LX36DRAFT_592050 [Colletotrichum falcatum]
MGRLVQLALACLYLGAESKILRWQDDTQSWVPPRETIAAMNMEELGLSPRPTAAPDLANVELKLAKRVRGDDTCGYISGISTDSIYCEVGSCVINSFYSVAGCCDSAALSDCRIPTTCLPASSSRSYSSADTLMLYCSSSARPECRSYVYSGAIVGGVVGGVAAIAIIVLGTVLLLRKKNKDPAAGNQPAPVVYNGPPPPQQVPPQMYQQPSPGGYGPPPPPQQGGTYPQGFAPVDNRQSMIKQSHNTTTAPYEQTGVSPPASPPPMSPSPAYQSGVPQYTPTQNGVSPTYPPTQNGASPTYPAHNDASPTYHPAPNDASPAYPTQQQQQQQQQRQSGYASELPAHRGDGELRELA